MANASPASTPLQEAFELQKQLRWQDSLAIIETHLRANGPHPVTYYLAGVAYENLHDFTAASTLFEAALKMDPRFDDAMRHLGIVYLNLELYDKAESVLNAANDRAPAAENYFNLGLIKLRTSRASEALIHFSRAVELNEADMESWEYLGQTYFLLGQFVHAIFIFNKLAKDHPKSLRYRHLLTATLRDFQPAKYEPVFRDILLFCLEEESLTLDNLNTCFTALLAQDPGHPLLQAGLQAASYDAFKMTVGTSLTEFDDTLLIKGLSSFLVRNGNFEKLLTWLRRLLLEYPVVAGKHLPLLAGMAAQCFLSEYIYTENSDEKSLVDDLHRKVQNAKSWTDDAVLDVLLLAAWRPLYKMADGIPLFAPDWIAQAPAPLAAILDDQITALRREKNIGTTIPSIGATADDTSQAVRAMYEENPYPRWKSVFSAAGGLNPMIDIAALKANATDGRLEILNAGCGTGRHLIISHASFPDAHVTAIDLSRASLGFAKMRAEEHGLTNIDFMQGDILELGNLDRQFDVIESAGVLHHLKDPMRGWRVLTGLLKSGGVMRIGLYSELARKAVVAARAFIAENGFEATPDDIRTCREALKTLSDLHPAKGIVHNPDFFSMSLCRDLIFHVQEHRFTIPQIKTCLDDLGLEFLSFNITNGRTLLDYSQTYKDDPKQQSLDHWAEFEQKHPHTFSNMYQFWCRKP